MNKSYNKILVTLLLSIYFLGCSKTQIEKVEYIIIKVPPILDKSLSKEENFWRFHHFLFPQEPIPNPIPKGLPNYDALLYITLEKNGDIKINSEINGNIQNTEILSQKLKRIFQERKENNVFEPNSHKVVKAVGIQAPLSTKYGDVLKVLSAIKKSGAEPMVLLIDGYPIKAIAKLNLEKEKISGL